MPHNMSNAASAAHEALAKVEASMPLRHNDSDPLFKEDGWLHLSRRGMWIAVGVTFLLVGAIGIFLPLIPTTGPLIVAAWAFAKGSPTLHRWLISNRLFGPFIVEWETYGVIKPRAKVLALSSMGLASAWMAFGAQMHWALAALGIVLCVVGAVYVASRPSSHAIAD